MALNLPIKNNSLVLSILGFRGPVWNKCSAFQRLFLFFSPQGHLADGGSRGHFWVTGSRSSNACALVLGHPCGWCSILLSVSVQWPPSLLNLLVDVSGSLAFAHMLAWPLLLTTILPLPLVPRSLLSTSLSNFKTVYLLGSCGWGGRQRRRLEF